MDHPGSHEHYEHLGAYLRDMRLHFRLSVEEAAERLKIRARYIQAIEEGKLGDLPGKVYTRGYIQNYCEFLGVDADAILARYKGVDELEKEKKFFEPIPTQKQHKPGVPVVGLSIAGLIGMYVVWYVFAGGEKSPGSGVEPVPQRIVQEAAHPVPVTEGVKGCVGKNGAAFPPCYREDTSLLEKPFVVEMPTPPVVEASHPAAGE